MERLLRMLIYATYPLLLLSILCFGNAIGFGSAFIANFVIVNRANETIVVTPVGTIDQEGHKALLPITVSAVVNLPALRRAAFRLAPGESVTINYDSDDINFSEIVVEDLRAGVYQATVDAHPTTNQFHGPLNHEYIVGNLTSLESVLPNVRDAALTASQSSNRARLLYFVLLGSWVAYGILTLLLRGISVRRTLPVRTQASQST